MSNTYLTAFNNLVIKFNDDLIMTFPEENDFKVLMTRKNFSNGTERIASIINKVNIPIRHWYFWLCI